MPLSDDNSVFVGGEFGVSCTSGSTTANAILQLTRRTTNPTPAVEGMVIASGSAGSSKLYYFNGSTWNALH